MESYDIYLNPEKEEKREGEKEIKNQFNKQKPVTNIIDINLTISIIALDVNGLSRLSQCIKNTHTQDPTICCLQEAYEIQKEWDLRSDDKQIH